LVGWVGLLHFWYNLLAVEEFVKFHHRKGTKEALDKVYSSEPSEMDPVLAKMQELSLAREDW
jgi:hypothetical protein